MITFSVANQKGGVAKTTSAHNIGTALARFHGKRTLLIDLDPQSSLTDSAGIDPDDLKTTIFDVLDGAAPSSAILPLEENLALLPTSSGLARAELHFSSVIGRENLLKKALRKCAGEYDFAVIDCPPSLGLLTVNAFVASQYLLVPVQAEYHALSGLKQLMETLEQIKENDLNSALDVLGIFMTLYDRRRKLNVQVENVLRPEWGALLLQTKIRDNVALAEAPSHDKDIFTYKKDSYGSQDYQDLTAEILRMLAGRAA